MKRINCYFVILLTCYLVVFSFPKTVFAIDPDRNPSNWSERCAPWINVGDETVQIPTIQGFECLFVNIVRVLLPLLVIALFVMLVLGSFEWLTSAGDPKKLQKARATLTYAILGLVIFFSIYFIFNLIETITNVNVNKFVIPGP